MAAQLYQVVQHFEYVTLFTWKKTPVKQSYYCSTSYSQKGGKNTQNAAASNVTYVAPPEALEAVGGGGGVLGVIVHHAELASAVIKNAVAHVGLTRLGDLGRHPVHLRNPIVNEMNRK